MNHCTDDTPRGWTRREFLAAAAVGTLAACRSGEVMTNPSPSRLPALFLSHGSPMLALDAVSGADFARLAGTFERPSALLVVSAHWEETPATVGAASTRELIYDFYGFDEALQRVRYPAPGAPELADRVAAMLGARRDDARGWDHGVWVPLVHMFPEADVPLVQLSLPSRARPTELLALGRELRRLRDEGVLIVGSGGMVHNLRRLDWSGGDTPPAWAAEFEAWARESLAARDLDALADFANAAPAPELAHPTTEHFLPLLVAAGAADDADPVTFPIGGFELGSLSRTAVRFG